MRLLDGEKVIEDKIISHLDAPTDFIAKRANVSFNNIPFSRNLKVIIDPENKIREILKGNNSSFVVTSSFKLNDSIMWSIYNNNFEQAWLKLLKDEYGDERKTFNINPKELGF